MATRQLDWKQPIRLRGGGDVKLYAHENEGKKAVIGSYFTLEEWIPCSWNLEGRYRTDGKPSSMDLVNEVADAVA